MPVHQNLNRRLVLGMIEGALRFVPLHHRDDLVAERAAQPIKLSDKVWDVGSAVGENQRTKRIGTAERISMPTQVPQD